VLPGSTADVYQFAPTFPAELAKKAFILAMKVYLRRMAERAAEERLKRQQQAAEATRRAWQAYQQAMWAAYNRRRQEMSFGQMGYAYPVPTGGDIGGAQDWVDVAVGIGGGIIDWWRDRDPAPTRQAPAPWYNYAPPVTQIPATAPPPTVAQTAAGGLFRPSAQRIVPLNEFSVIGPDGKSHTWLHARPKGWKVNKANVSGRTRRCCRK
jgi:hypothetical protein